MEDVEELKPCPFDNTTDIRLLEHRGRPFWTIECWHCSVSLYGDDPTELRKQWNTRPREED